MQLTTCIHLDYGNNEDVVLDKGANKDAKIFKSWHLLVSSSVRSKQLLCLVQGQSQKSKQKHTIKNFVGFHNHSPLLTMFWKRSVKVYIMTMSINRQLGILSIDSFGLLCLISSLKPGELPHKKDGVARQKF